MVIHQTSQLTQLCVSPTAKPVAREDTVQSNFLPHKSFPEKSPVNGTSEQPPKSNSGAPGASSYNRFTPKPFTTSAKPFARMFDSPKFNHNLLPNDKPESVPKVGVGRGGAAAAADSEMTHDSCYQQGRSSSPLKPHIPPQPQNIDHDSGLDTFTRTMEHRPKHQHNNVNAVPKAIPVR